MNNIEKAIEYFELSKNCIPKNETKEYRTLFVEMADTAIEALKQAKSLSEMGIPFEDIQKEYIKNYLIKEG